MTDLPDDSAAFGNQMQEALSSGGFNPFALLSGEKRFQAVFIAPFSPALERAIADYLERGAGPLQTIGKQFERDGVSGEEAAGRARALFAAAQGVCVVVLADNQGPLSVPQLFFGAIDEAYRKQTVELCGKDFGDRDAVAAAMLGLQRLQERGARWPDCFVAGDGAEDRGRFWTGLARLLVHGLDEGLLGGGAERIADLAHWIARALGEIGTADGEQLWLRARCQLAAGAVAEAAASTETLLRDFEVEDEALAVLLERLVDTAIARRGIAAVLRLLDAQRARMDEVLGGCYELALPRFKARVAAMAPVADLIAAAEELRSADRKSFRHDLNREPLWRIAVEEPGELLDTLAAAELLDRSTNFVAKRLEQGSIPHWHDGDQLHIPKTALEHWRTLMERFELLD